MNEKYKNDINENENNDHNTVIDSEENNVESKATTSLKEGSEKPKNNCEQEGAQFESNVGSDNNIASNSICNTKKLAPVLHFVAKKLNLNTQKLVGIAIFSALAFVVSLLIRFPVQFLTFDAKDAIITVAAFAYGPIAAPIVSFFAALIELVTISDTGWYGFLMNFVSSAAYSLTASLIYSKIRSLNGAIIGIYSAVAVTTSAMLGLNILITPIYMQQFLGVPMTAAGIVAMIPTTLLPFNFAKTLLNSAVVMLIYKPLTISLSRLGICPKTRGGTKFTKSSVIILISGLVSLVAAVVIFLVLSANA